MFRKIDDMTIFDSRLVPSSRFPLAGARIGRSAPPQRTERSEVQAVFDEKASHWRLWQHRRLVPSRWRSCGVDSSRWQRIRQQPWQENQTAAVGLDTCLPVIAGRPDPAVGGQPAGG